MKTGRSDMTEKLLKSRLTGFIQAKLCKFKDFLRTFLLFSRTEILRKIQIYTSEMLESITEDISLRKLV